MLVVSSLEAARAALREGARSLRSPAYAACHAGVNYWWKVLEALRAEFADVDFTFALCCGEDAAIAHDALRMGFARVICDCGPGQFAELEVMARMLGAQVMRPARVACG